MLLHYLGKLNTQIFCRYSADTEENANKLHFDCTDFNSSMRVTVSWVYLCIYCLVYLQNIWNISTDVKSLTVSTFSSVAALRGLPLPVDCACVPQLFQQPINTTLCLAFLGKFVCEPLCCVPLQIQTFIKFLSSSLNTILIVDKHCCDVCCDVFQVPQIDRKS